LNLITKLLDCIGERFLLVLAAASSVLKTRAALGLENIALRHQIGVLQRSAKKRVFLSASDRLLWVWLTRMWPDWRSALLIVRPETAICVASEGLSAVLDVESLAREARTASCPDLIRTMSHQNPHWGAPRIHGNY
jgi:hypothetical protein